MHSHFAIVGGVAQEPTGNGTIAGEDTGLDGAKLGEANRDPVVVGIGVGARACDRCA